jgi:hypothetical protein
MVNSYRHDPNRMSYLIDGEEAEYVGSDNEEVSMHDYSKSEIKEMAHVNSMSQMNMIKKKIDSIHHYESQISVDNSECGSNNYTDNNSNFNYISFNETEMQSNFPSENSGRGEEYETQGGYDTIRKFNLKKMENFNSNDIKY